MRREEVKTSEKASNSRGREAAVRVRGKTRANLGSSANDCGMYLGLGGDLFPIALAEVRPFRVESGAVEHVDPDEVADCTAHQGGVRSLGMMLAIMPYTIACLVIVSDFISSRVAIVQPSDCRDPDRPGLDLRYWLSPSELHVVPCLSLLWVATLGCKKTIPPYRSREHHASRVRTIHCKLLDLHQ